MSEDDVVGKMVDLMATLDEVRKYRELAYAMIDFVAILVISFIVVILLNLVQDAYDVASSVSVTSGFFPTIVGGMPSNVFLPLGSFLIPLAGLLGGSLWVRTRVNRVKVGEWKQTLHEGAPGAVKLLSGMDWDAVLSMVRNSRAAFLFYEIVTIAGYWILASILLFIAASLTGTMPFDSTQEGYLAAIALITVLILTRKGLVAGFAKLQSLDLLFWDLRVLSTEFKRAEFNKA